MPGSTPLIAPDVLVLAAGGIVGEAWMTGVLAGIEDATSIDFRRTEQLVGTSAGAIVAASLAAGHAPRRPRDAGRSRDGSPLSQPEPAASSPVRELAGALVAGAWAAGAPLAMPLLSLGAPAGAIARALVLARLPGGDQTLDDLRDAPQLRDARFDGRLRVVAVDRANGRRVVFGAPGAPRAAVGAAVAASCAVPGIFRPVRIGARSYVDGGAWSLTNLDVATAGRDTQVLCLNVVEALPLSGAPAPLVALRVGGRIGEAVEAQVLRRRGAQLRTIAPDADSTAAIGGELMHRSRAADALAAGYRQGMALGSGRPPGGPVAPTAR